MATPYQDRPLPAPPLSPEVQPYFDAAARGELWVKHCPDCGANHHYPRALCPFCLSDKVQWKPAAGTGTIYAVTVTRKAGPIVYALAYVTLDDTKVTMLTNIVDCDLDAVRIGQKVKVVFKPAEGGVMVPMFTPSAS